MVAPDWLERLAGETRLKVMQLLQRGDRTNQEVAEEVGVTPNAIRGHMAALERDGLVLQTGVRRDTEESRRPPSAVTQEADEIFPKAYAFVLERLMDAVETRLGSSGLRELLDEVGVEAATPGSGSPEARVTQAAAALRALGGSVEVRHRDGMWTLRGSACPLSAVTRQDARACGLVEALVRETSWRACARSL